MSHIPTLFISYSQNDGDAAASLLDLLESAGVQCFMAEKSIAPGAEWDAAIREAIRKSDRLLVLVTPKSKDSVWVAAEVGAAWVLGKAVIPALQSIEANELFGPICKFQARKAETEKEIKSLVRELCGQHTVPKVSAESSDSATRFSLSDIPNLSESFTDRASQDLLLKVGTWSFDLADSPITGKGMYRYLLSHYIYGSHPYTIHCRITFSDLHPENQTDAVNAGIVLGWSVPVAARRYCHIAFSGTHVFFERIGNNEGDDYWDFEHLSQEVPFPLTVNQPYEFSIIVNSGNLLLLRTGQEVLRAQIPSDFIIGRVGLRPWRSTMRCDQFIVEEQKS